MFFKEKVLFETLRESCGYRWGYDGDKVGIKEEVRYPQNDRQIYHKDVHRVVNRVSSM